MLIVLVIVGVTGVSFADTFADIDNNQVVESIGVWRSLKNNNSWIQSSPEKKNSEQDNVRYANNRWQRVTRTGLRGSEE